MEDFKEMDSHQIYEMFENLSSIKPGESIYFKPKNEVLMHESVQTKGIFTKRESEVYDLSFPLVNPFGILTRFGGELTNYIPVDFDSGLLLKFTNKEFRSLLNTREYGSIVIPFEDKELNQLSENMFGTNIRIARDINYLTKAYSLLSFYK